MFGRSTWNHFDEYPERWLIHVKGAILLLRVNADNAFFDEVVIRQSAVMVVTVRAAYLLQEQIRDIKERQ